MSKKRLRTLVRSGRQLFYPGTGGKIRRKSSGDRRRREKAKAGNRRGNQWEKQKRLR